MKILISTSSYDTTNSPILEHLASNGFDCVLNPHGRRLTEAEVAELLTDDVVGMIAGVEPLTRRVLEGARSLKVISRAGIGMDSVDLSAAAELGILVDNTPNAPVAAVAELTVAMMLDLLRKVSASDRDLRAGKWKPLMGNLLGSQTVGLIGCGRIGTATARLLQAFGSSLLVCDPMYTGSEARRVDLDELLGASDVVSLHVPYGKATHHLINAERMACMKPGALLINTSRGGLIDEAALVESLQHGHLAGAGLDTYEQEPYNGPLTTMPQAVLTAHMGSYAKESRSRMEREAAENLAKGLRSKGLLADTV